ncbi:MAG: ImmA/IrrE family metallo-endopeptidase [Chitinophagaceae bacterium]|nr:ImmA/IrrE family metallo-endopeptidase [Chitinophagaceae bacterium]
MPEKNSKHQDINSLLNDILRPDKPGLKELFDKKISELKITSTSVLEILNIQHRTLKGILDGTQKVVDVTNLIKIANFLQLPKEDVIKMYIDSLEKNYTESIVPPEKIKFIQENFDLAALKKAGFIDSLTDFEKIDSKITSFLGLKSIYEYKRPNIKPAFSAGLVKPKNELTRSLWIQSAITYFEDIDNPYEYNRKALIEYFPNIRWHSTNVEFGLLTIIKDLFKLGVTIIYQSPLPSLHLRGATFAVNDKPCIVLTNYVGFYGTLWFALIHELFHVLFDWEEIRTNMYHLSDDEDNELIVQEKENEANQFAREYLFPQEKMKQIKHNLNNPYFVSEFAKNNQVHPSIIYVFNAFDSSKTNRMPWARARKNEPAELSKCISHLENPWSNSMPINEIVKNKKLEIYN